MTTAIEHAGFLAAIIEEPHDDFHRLIYADWLEDHGEEERAEFIRVQCLEEVDYRATYNAAAGSDRKGCQLLRRFGHRWLGPLYEAGWGRECVWSRGFIAEVHGLTFDLWKEHGPRLVRQHPLELVKLAVDCLYREQGHDEWFTDVISLPGWFRAFYESQRPPHLRRTPEEAEKCLSDVLIAWAKAQPLPEE